MAKKAETASSTMDFYQTSLRKFVQFLGQRADEPIGDITKQDVVASDTLWLARFLQRP
jgi:hypothetical protein